MPVLECSASISCHKSLVSLKELVMILKYNAYYLENVL